VDDEPGRLGPDNADLHVVNRKNFANLRCRHQVAPQLPAGCPNRHHNQWFFTTELSGDVRASSQWLREIEAQTNAQLVGRRNGRHVW
jgi:hypothetical protein